MIYHVYLLLAVLVYASFTFAQKASVVTHPQLMNVSLNGFATFNCTAIASLITWEIDGVLIDGDSGLSNKGFDDTAPVVTLNSTQDLRGTSLRVLGSLNNNNTSIKCVAIIPLTLSTSDVDVSEPALMLVQGLLGSVNSLTVTLINSTTVLISWSPPFTLEGVPILGYNVTITNTTSGENETMLVEDTTLLYSIDLPDPENNFTVTVVPINEVGAGNSTLLSFVIIATSPNLPDQATSSMVDMFTTTTQAFTPTSTSSLVNVSSTVIVLGTDHFPELSPPSRVIIVIGATVGAIIILIVLVVLVLIGLIVIKMCSRPKSRSRRKLSDNQYTYIIKRSSVHSETSHTDQSTATTADSEKGSTTCTCVCDDTCPCGCTCKRVEHNKKSDYQSSSVHCESGHPEKNTSTTADSEKALLPYEPSHLLSTHSEPAADHVQQVIGTAADFEQRRMFLSERVEEEEDLLPSDQHHSDSDNYEESDNRKDVNTIEELKDEDIQQIHIGGHTASVQNESISSSSDETYDIQNSKPKETQYADLAFLKDRPRAPPSMTSPVVYATISGVSREPMHGNTGTHKRQAAAMIYGVPTKQQRKLIARRVKSKWRLLGIHLGVDQAELDQISHDCGSDNDLSSSELFRKWAAQEVSTSCPFTWKGVIESLDNDVVKEPSMARQLESTYL